MTEHAPQRNRNRTEADPGGSVDHRTAGLRPLPSTPPAGSLDVMTRCPTWCREHLDDDREVHLARLGQVLDDTGHPLAVLVGATGDADDLDGPSIGVGDRLLPPDQIPDLIALLTAARDLLEKVDKFESIASTGSRMGA